MLTYFHFFLSVYSVFKVYYFSLISPLIGHCYIQNLSITASYNVRRVGKKRRLKRVNQHLNQIIWMTEYKNWWMKKMLLGVLIFSKVAGRWSYEILFAKLIKLTWLETPIIRLKTGLNVTYQIIIIYITGWIR